MISESENGTATQNNSFYIATQFQKIGSENPEIVIDKEGEAGEEAVFRQIIHWDPPP